MPRAAKEILFIAGAVLVGLALGSAIASVLFGRSIFAFLVFFFGVWGGVELGRCLEHSLSADDGDRT